MDLELIVGAVVGGVIGVAGTLIATHMANANARKIMTAQWERDDQVAKQAAGKQAAKEILSEIASAATLFDHRHWRERAEAAEAEFGRRPPEWLLGPDRRSLEPHYRAISQRLLEIPDMSVVNSIRAIVNIMQNHEEAVKHGNGAIDTVTVGQTVESAAGVVLAAYIQGDPQPDLKQMDRVRRINAAVDEAARDWQRSADEEAAIDDSAGSSGQS